MSNSFLSASINEFERYKALGEKTIDQLPEEDLFWQYNPESNSIAMIVQHLSGNMLSRWTDIFTTDGEKETRNRDQEFERVLGTKTEVLDSWEKGWARVFETLHSLTEADLERIIYIRSESHTVTQAILRQLSHYPYIGKLLLDGRWNSLSIPRNGSQEFNLKMKSGNAQA